MDNYKAIMMNEKDNVATVLENIPEQAIVPVTVKNNTYTITLKSSMAFGHKFAVKPIKKGEEIQKYGEIIGIATKDIDVGEHVHVQNLEGKRGRGDKIAK